VLPGAVRPIEYEVMPTNEAASIGVAPDVFVGMMDEIGVIRCVDDRGEKLTTVCDAKHLRRILLSGEASEPSGMRLSRQVFPVVILGWVRANERPARAHS